MISLLTVGKRVQWVSLCLPLDESFGPNLSLSRVEVNIEDCCLEDIKSKCSTNVDYVDSTKATQSATEVCFVLSHVKTNVMSLSNKISCSQHGSATTIV